MAIGGWVLAASLAALLGWLGRPIMMLLPESSDAAPHAPAPIALARRPHLCWWLAGAAVAMITMLSLALDQVVLPAWIVVCGIGTWLAYIDWHTRVLSTKIIVPMFGIAFVAVLLEAWLADDLTILARGIGGTALAVGSFWCLWWIAEQCKPGSFGFGDVRFSAPLGLALGSVSIWAVPVGLYLGFAIGAVASWAIKSRDDGVGDAVNSPGFAFGPAMLAGAVIGALLCGSW